MQRKREYNEKLFTPLQLSEYAPEDNFYRRLKQVNNSGHYIESKEVPQIH